MLLKLDYVPAAEVIAAHPIVESSLQFVRLRQWDVKPAAGPTRAAKWFSAASVYFPQYETSASPSIVSPPRSANPSGACVTEERSAAIDR